MYKNTFVLALEEFDARSQKRAKEIVSFRSCKARDPLRDRQKFLVLVHSLFFQYSKHLVVLIPRHLLHIHGLFMKRYRTTYSAAVVCCTGLVDDGFLRA